MLRKQGYNFTLILLIVFENLFSFFFFHRKITSQPVNSTGYFVVSVFIGIILLMKFYGFSELSVSESRFTGRKFFLLLLSVGCLLFLNSITIDILKTIGFRGISDIITAIQLMVQKFLAGDYPYGPAVFEPLGYHGPPGYLPMHWLPYCFAEYFKFDYRTVSFAIWSIGAFVIMFRSMRCKELWLQIFIPLLLSSAYWLITIVDPYPIAVTIEIMVAGYYMLLMAGLNQKNNLIAGLCISICLLSRYYVALWLPLWGFALFVSGNKKQLFRTLISIFIFVSIVYILPFLSKDWSSFYVSHKNYENVPISEWTHFNNDGLPMHLYSGFGFGYLFYQKYLHTDYTLGYKLLKNVLFISTSLAIFIMGVWYWFNRKKMNNRIFLLASFKIYLSVFLAFIMVPYLYLMMTANFLSIAIFAEQARYSLEKDPKVNTPA